MIQLASLIAAGIGPTQARLFESPLVAACTRFEIDTPLREAAFVAECAHESRLFTALEEALFYRTPERICAIFPKAVPTLALAKPLCGDPKRLANRVYANRNGNGDEASGDGWRYRGRGLIQLTGRANYSRAATELGRPYVDEPDLVHEPVDAALTAAWFWHAGNLNALADASRIDAITRAINGAAMAGADERRRLFSAALAAFEAAPAAPMPAGPAPATLSRERGAPSSIVVPTAVPKPTKMAPSSGLPRDEPEPPVPTPRPRRHKTIVPQARRDPELETDVDDPGENAAAAAKPTRRRRPASAALPERAQRTKPNSPTPSESQPSTRAEAAHATRAKMRHEPGEAPAKPSRRSAEAEPDDAAPVRFEARAKTRPAAAKARSNAAPRSAAHSTKPRADAMAEAPRSKPRARGRLARAKA